MSSTSSTSWLRAAAATLFTAFLALFRMICDFNKKHRIIMWDDDSNFKPDGLERDELDFLH